MSWQVAKLSDVCEFHNGLWKGEKGPFVNVGVIRNTNFAKDGMLDDSDIAYLDVESKKFEKRRLQFGDIILEKSGGGPKQAVGRVAFFDKKSGDYSFSNFTSAIRVRDPKALSAEYLHRFLHWQYLSGVTESMQSHSTGIRNLDGGAYKAIEVAFPDISEQHRIVALLDEAFAGIATAKANAEKSLRNVREASDSASQQILDSAGGDELSLESIAAEDCSLSYGIVQPGNDVEAGLPVVRPVDLTREVITLDGLKRINPELASSYQRTKLQGGELLLCVRGTTGTVSVAASELEGANVTRGIVPIRFKPERVADAFGYHLMKSASVQSQIREKTYGAALMQINIGDLRKVLTRIPPLAKQRELAKRLDGLRLDTSHLESLTTRKLAALDELRQSLLQRAFSGQLT